MFMSLPEMFLWHYIWSALTDFIWVCHRHSIVCILFKKCLLSGLESVVRMTLQTISPLRGSAQCSKDVLCRGKNFQIDIDLIG